MREATEKKIWKRETGNEREEEKQTLNHKNDLKKDGKRFLLLAIEVFKRARLRIIMAVALS